jgi:hypothetical protein
MLAETLSLYPHFPAVAAHGLDRAAGAGAGVGFAAKRV